MTGRPIVISGIAADCSTRALARNIVYGIQPPLLARTRTEGAAYGW